MFPSACIEDSPCKFWSCWRGRWLNPCRSWLPHFRQGSGPIWAGDRGRWWWWIWLICSSLYIFISVSPFNVFLSGRRPRSGSADLQSLQLWRCLQKVQQVQSTSGIIFSPPSWWWLSLGSSSNYHNLNLLLKNNEGRTIKEGIDLVGPHSEMIVLGGRRFHEKVFLHDRKKIYVSYPCPILFDFLGWGKVS